MFVILLNTFNFEMFAETNGDHKRISNLINTLDVNNLFCQTSIGKSSIKYIIGGSNSNFGSCFQDLNSW